MRGIYNETTLTTEAGAPLLRKILGTFAAFGSVVAVVGCLAFSIIIATWFAPEALRRALLVAVALTGLAGAATLGALYLILRRSLGDLVNLVRWAEVTEHLEQIPVPIEAAAEIHTIYDMFNAAIERLHKSQRDLVEAERLTAVARTTQMLAHDIRRPFTKLRSGLAMLEHVEDVAEMQRLVGRVSHQVEGDLASVNHMLADILVAGNDVKLEVGEVDPNELVLNVVTDLFLLHPTKDVALDMTLGASRQVRADAGKLTRIASNILDNAIQAMPSGGRLWVRTRLIGDGPHTHVETAIGNTGSTIAPEDLPRLFEPFFTKGKKNGTGLGLSIVQRLVEAHGGTISCTSSLEHGTEFVFTIPAGEAEAPAPATPLPTSSVEARATRDASTAHVPADDDSGSRISSRKEAVLEASIRRAADALGRPLRMLVVDDEEIYCQALEKRLLGGRRLAGAAEVRGATTAAAALSIVREWLPDLVVCDIDLGDPSQDGFDVVSRMREAGYRGKLCVHSNRSDTRSYEAALAVGANAFLPKPMSRIHLLDLLVAASDPGPAAATVAALVPIGEPVRAKIAVVDDDVFMLEAWETALGADAAPVTFTSPAEFWKAVEKAPELLGDLRCVVTDFHFDNCASDDGVSFAEAVHQRAPRVPILLSSNAALPRGAERVVHRVIDKAPMSWAKLAAAAGLEATAN